MLIAATGVGAGDLITAAIAGSKLGVAIVWAALVGALLKWVLNEGVARWQMATGTTLLEGASQRLGAWVRWGFLAYFVVWMLAVGAALANACGVAGHGLLPLDRLLPLESWFSGGTAPAGAAGEKASRIIWAILHSMAGLAIARAGGFKWFERVMAVLTAVMFVTVLATALLMAPDWAAVARGLAMPRLPGTVQERQWILGVIGGVGGTVTLLCYGYWIREDRRSGAAGLALCRVDLGAGYLLTGLFGAAMILIGSRISIDGKGAGIGLRLAEQLAQAMGPWGSFGKWAFLAGFWGAVFTSLLGVWQSAPYLFADFWALHRQVPPDVRRELDFTTTRAYRWCQLAIALLPLLLLGRTVTQIQLAYAVLGACFMPLLAAALLVLNNRRAWVGAGFRNGLLTNAMLGATLAYFVWQGWLGIGE